MKRTSLFQSLLFAAVLLPGLAGASVTGAPLKINFQGRLDENSQPVDGTKTFVFRIYDVSSGGTALWVSQPQTIDVSKGVFSAELSVGTLADLSTPSNISTSTFSGPRYVEIVVDGQALSPYQEIVSAPYALVAQALAPNAELPVSGITDGSITDVKVTLSTAAISSGKFGDDRVAVTTAAVTAGKFSDDRVQITTGAFTGGFNGASQLVQLDGSGNLAINGGVSAASLQASGALTLPVKIVSADYNVTPNDSTVVINAPNAAATIQINLPSAAGIPGRIYSFKVEDPGSTSSVDINAYGLEGIDGSSPYPLSGNTAAVTLQSDGANWMVLSWN